MKKYENKAEMFQKRLRYRADELCTIQGYAFTPGTIIQLIGVRTLGGKDNKWAVRFVVEDIGIMVYQAMEQEFFESKFTEIEPATVRIPPNDEFHFKEPKRHYEKG